MAKLPLFLLAGALAAAPASAGEAISREAGQDQGCESMLVPTDEDTTHYRKGYWFYRKSELKSAILEFNEVILREPESASHRRAILAQGVAFDLIGDGEAAAGNFAALLREFPNSPEARCAARQVPHRDERNGQDGSLP